MFRLFVIGILLCYSKPSIGQEKELFQSEINQHEKHLSIQKQNSIASSWFDVTYYGLNLTVITSPQHLKGIVTIEGICREPVSTILTFDLMNSLHVDSVKVDGILYTFVQQPASLDVNLDVIYPADMKLKIEIYYQGLPVGTGFGSFMFGMHSDVPWVWSLSEPYGARDWFPCKDHPSDKADSADITVTCDSSFKVGSNGKLFAVINNGDGTKTHYWQERYPIASYLISIAITNYQQFSNWFHYSPTDSMEILNYVIPERLSSALSELPKTIDMLKIFSDLFGLYPFIKEKYGHADFGRGGAMEHQTMTSTTTYEENTIAHELAHQWFGDMITCRTWSDLWLNEGFAQYATALYLEKKYGEREYWNYMRNQLSNARLAVGSVYVKDTAVVRNLFDGRLVYSKGASVLHMLRHVLGDTVFFNSMYEYANHTSLKYGTAETKDFRSVCEYVSGKDLGYFFDEWIYGENFPHYSLGWHVDNAQSQNTIAVTIKQTMNTTNLAFFTMPIDLKLIGEGWDTTVTVFNNSTEQIFYVPVSHTVTEVQLDPGEWILRNILEEIYSDFSLSQNYPNPFKVSTRIDYHVPSRTRVKLVVYNVLGQKVVTLCDEVKTMGNYTAVWNAGGFPSGVYFYRMQTSNKQVTGKMVLISPY